MKIRKGFRYTIYYPRIGKIDEITGLPAMPLNLVSNRLFDTTKEAETTRDKRHPKKDYSDDIRSIIEDDEVIEEYPKAHWIKEGIKEAPTDSTLR